MISSIRRIDPVTEMQRMSEMFDRLFGSNAYGARAIASANEYTIPLDVVEKEDKIVIRASVPGISPDDLDISIENNVLTITGESKHEEESENDKVYVRECSYGSFKRSIRLPENLDIDHVDAEFSNGFVSVSLPKIPEEKPKTVKVELRKS